MKRLIDWIHRNRIPLVRDDPLGDEIRATLKALNESIEASRKLMDEHEATCPLCRDREAK